MTSRNLAVVEGTAAIATGNMFSDARVDMIRNQVAVGSPDLIFAAFIDIAKRRNLDPLAKQISLVKIGGKWVIITTIDGYRAIAEQTGHYAGSDAPVFTYAGVITPAKKTAPDTATVTVHKLINGQSYPFSATVYFEEYSTNQNTWSTMPRTMLAKVAESHALRKAFPAVMSGMYEESEMDQAIEGTARVTGSRAHIDEGTGEIHDIRESGFEDWDRANKRLHAIAGTHGITDDDLHLHTASKGIARLHDVSAADLHNHADLIERKPEDAKAYYASLREKSLAIEAPAPQQHDEQQAEMDAINNAVGAAYDAQRIDRLGD